MMMGAMCKCPHHKVVPGLITLIGVLFLLNALGSLSDQSLHVWWPIALIAIGLMKMFKNACKCCAKHV